MKTLPRKVQSCFGKTDSRDVKEWVKDYMGSAEWQRGGAEPGSQDKP